MEKYYTPSIEEFRIGFEYEIEMGGNWYLRDIPFYPLVDDSGLEYRVKYLDREDIESFGFEFIDDLANILTFRFNKRFLGLGSGDDYYLYLDYDIDDNLMEIYSRTNRGDESTSASFIKIKNKSELEILLKQLSIIK